MDWKALLADLDQCSLFEVGCLARAAGDMIDDPVRVAKARSLFRPGLEVEYWDTRDKRFVKAIVLELLRTSAFLEHMDDKQRWRVHLSLIVPPDSKPVIPSTPSPAKSEWRVGDLVGFKDNQNRERVGVIEKLNPRRAQVRLKTGEIWRVGYSLLVRIHEFQEKKRADPPDFLEYKEL